MQKTNIVDAATDPFTMLQTRAFRDHWFDLKPAPDQLPSRAQFDPLAIPKLLPDFILFERINSEKYFVRLQGTKFRDRNLSDRTGNLLEPIPDNPVRTASLAAMNRILDTPCGMKFLGVEQNAEGKNTLAETAAFPLTDDEGTPRFIVALVAEVETLGYADDKPLSDSVTELREIVEIKLW